MLCLDLSRASVESTQCSPAECFPLFYLTHLTRGDNLACSEVRRASAPSTNWIPTWSVLMFLVCFAWFFVLTCVLLFSSPFSKEGCWIRQLEGFVETQHLHAFRIHLCQSFASHSSLKDHERLAIACSFFYPMFALPRSKGFLDDTPCLCLSPLRPVMKERLSFLGLRGLRRNAGSVLSCTRHHGLRAVFKVSTVAPWDAEMLLRVRVFMAVSLQYLGCILTF